ncbi:uncharacterized protein LOC121087945 [Falco naumanni]|uniref:uncharacterized protein LOC121087945 n=1 Tax=Falco naumanni TaxID=148594 RepID=UPI001ADE6CC9|nr:uncharacterized protein LOC121087945 [Falco naumanni]
MAGIPASHPRQSWQEKDRAAPAPSSRLKPNNYSCHSDLAAPTEEENTLDIIRGFLRIRPKQADQKLKFLAAICTACGTATMDSSVWDELYYFQWEVVDTIQVLLQEEPTDDLGTTVWQQAMLAITSMSRVGLLLEEKTSSLLQACFRSIFYQHPQEDTQDPEASLYSKTMAVMDSMLKVLVCSAGTLGILELQNILQVLLPFTRSQREAVQERAVAQIASLIEFTTCSMPQVCSCFAQTIVLRHQCSKSHQFAILGLLVGHLILCCTCKRERTRHKAAEALHHLHTFILKQRSKRGRVGLGPPQHGQPVATLLGQRKPHTTCLPACSLKSHFLSALLTIAPDPPCVSAPQTCQGVPVLCQ